MSQQITIKVVMRDNQQGTPYRDVYLVHENKSWANGCVGLIRQEGSQWRIHSDRNERLYSSAEAAAVDLAGQAVRDMGQTEIIDN